MQIRYELGSVPERWLLPEEPVPESAWHAECVELLKALLACWARQSGRDLAIYGNLAVRLDAARPRVGFDPDLLLVIPAPPEKTELESLQLWRPDHAAPALVIEVVSPNHPQKDYAETPDKCAVAGVRELVVFDPKLAGPRAGGGPHRLQLWRRGEEGSFRRVHASERAAWSEVLSGWFVPIAGGERLALADDARGDRLWSTAEQLERAAKEAERAAKEMALKRVAELEAELARRRGE
jgi:Uma2 family endonuclease